MRAAFLRPGVYDLNRFRFVVHMAADSAQLVPGVVGARLRVVDGRVRVPYIFSAQYVVKVEEEAEEPPPPSQQQSQRQQAGGAGAIQRVLSSALGLAVAGPSSSAGAAAAAGANGPEEALVTLVEKTLQMSLAGPAGPPAGAAVDGSTAAAPHAHPSPATPGSWGFHDVVATPNLPPGARIGSPTPAGGAGAFRFEAEGEQGQEGAGEVEVQEDQRFNEEGQERAAALMELQDGGEAAAAEDGEDGEQGAL